MRRTVLAISIALLSCVLPAAGQSVKEFKEVCDSLSVLAKERTSVTVELALKKVSINGNKLDFRFSETLGDLPLRKEDIDWFRTQLGNLFPEKYSNYGVGRIYSNGIDLNELAVPHLTRSGHPAESRWRRTDPRGSTEPLIEYKGSKYFNKGLSGRYIALWQSHGRYYETKFERWEWQRAQDFMTVEDMYTQSYVLPFLIPMLENAGAYVMTPRERDTQVYECIVDNDPAFEGERSGLLRRSGEYTEEGSWKTAGVGFADAKQVYIKNDNPFTMGSVRMAECVEGKEGDSSIKWAPDVPERGIYALYLSYKTLPNSTRSAHYTVHHLGGESELIVNQQMGGGTWIYAGSYEFDEGCYVTLDNGTPEGRSFVPNSVVTADAVRIGGGMGKIARGLDEWPEDEYTLSGLPAFAEGALYSMQWAGIDTTITRRWNNDYTCDYATRGQWVGRMAGGSPVNPDSTGMGIPIDMSFAFHTDAGVSPNDSIIGTLSIYTLMCDGKRELPNGEDRMQAREYCDYLQTQIVEDLRSCYNPEWSRRQLWDRSYSESRTTFVPGALLELLSHQNFADMKYGLDPSFRFAVSRAVYKGMLKYLSNRYGCSYAVQPLPVQSFAAVLGSGSVRLSWKPRLDSLEMTADPTGYILYTRIDDGAFDQGVDLGACLEGSDGRCSAEVGISKGHIYSYKIVAYNEGGKSFPSEILSVGIPASSAKGTVLIVNNFTRVSAPAWFDTPEYAGFDTRLDGGVAYGKEINFIGEMYQFRRQMPWTDDDNPGFGASFTDEAGTLIAGNSFDYPFVHGKALMELGYPFCSVSSAAFSEQASIREGFFAADIICGKQVTTTVGAGLVPPKYEVFPIALQKALRDFTAGGGNVLISGSNIGTDVWDAVYPVPYDTLAREQSAKFVSSVLGYSWRTNYASKHARVRAIRNGLLDIKDEVAAPLTFHNERNPKVYCVETPDGIIPANSKKASTFLRYDDTNISAGVAFQGSGYRTVSLGFPLETMCEPSEMTLLLRRSLEFFEKE